MEQRIKFEDEVYLTEVHFTYSENGKIYASTNRVSDAGDSVYRIRFDVLNGVHTKDTDAGKTRGYNIIKRLNENNPGKYPLEGEHYTLKNGENGTVAVTKKKNCPLFRAPRRISSLIFRLMLLFIASALAFFLFRQTSGITFAEALFPSLSLKKLTYLLVIIQAAVALFTFAVKKDNFDIPSIINCACVPLASVWALGAVKTSIVLGIIAAVALLVCGYLYVLPFVKDLINEKRKAYKKEIARDIAAQGVYSLSFCLAICIFGTSLFGVTGYSYKSESTSIDTAVSDNYFSALRGLLDWEELDTEERLDTLQHIHDYEAKSLGVESTDLRIAYPADSREQGSYNPLTGEISISREHIEASDVLEVLNTVLHETRHIYQHVLSEMYTDIEDELDEEYKSLEVFSKARVFRHNMSNYKDAEGDGSEYYCQPLEDDARAWAKELTENKYEKILNNTYYWE